jgi:hypothetical protein
VRAGGGGDREGSEERPTDADAAADAAPDANGNGTAAAEQAPADAEADAEGLEGPSPAKPTGGGLRMWRAARDRAAWKADVLHVRRSPVTCCPEPQSIVSKRTV